MSKSVSGFDNVRHNSKLVLLIQHVHIWLFSLPKKDSQKTRFYSVTNFGIVLNNMLSENLV